MGWSNRMWCMVYWGDIHGYGLMERAHTKCWLSPSKGGMNYCCGQIWSWISPSLRSSDNYSRYILLSNCCSLLISYYLKNYKVWPPAEGWWPSATKWGPFGPPGWSNWSLGCYATPPSSFWSWLVAFGHLIWALFLYGFFVLFHFVCLFYSSWDIHRKLPWKFREHPTWFGWDI